ncbi:type II toxin-antitoxin system VapC family toxin, partial [Mycobacterium sp. XDR-29]|uniref:type II toxin-antitoxin system VapC family toxin n=6 Tax=Mycobacterium TaxID=1763 RepID=UPI0035A57781
MIIPDINLLLYAVITGFPQHRRAHAWWQDTVNGHTRIGLTYPALFGFLRIATSARVLAAPLPTADAIAYVREWLSQPNVDLLTAGPRHLDIALGLLDKLGTASHLTTDVQLAAYGIEYDSKYPYTPDGNREFMDGKPFIETFVLTAALGACLLYTS